MDTAILSTTAGKLKSDIFSAKKKIGDGLGRKDGKIRGRTKKYAGNLMQTKEISRHKFSEVGDPQKGGKGTGLKRLEGERKTPEQPRRNPNLTKGGREQGEAACWIRSMKQSIDERGSLYGRERS